MSRALRRRRKKNSNNIYKSDCYIDNNYKKKLENILAAQRAGRLDQAEVGYLELLRECPDDYQALHGMGMLANQVGNNARAEEWILKALAVRPDFYEALSNLGSVLVEQGRFNESVGYFRKAIAVHPGFAQDYYNLGNVYLAVGNLEEALANYRQVLVLDPKFAEAYLNMGSVFHSRGMMDDALQCYRHALVLRKDYPEAFVNIGLIFQYQRKYSVAIDHYRRALALRPHYPEAHSRWGVALQDMGDLSGAIECYRRALALRPDYPEALSHLGGALLGLERLLDANECLQKALAFRSLFPEALANLGHVFHKQGRMLDALECFRRSIDSDPNFAEAHFGEGLTCLLLGNYARGWDKYEWRWRTRAFRPHGHAQPLWDGSSLVDRTILLHCEQGFGDSLQFIRFIPQIKERGANVVVFCPPELQRLFSKISAVDHLVTRVDAIPPCEYQLPLMSLGKLLDIALDCIPADVPYLHVDSNDVEKFRKRLDFSEGFKVGVVWRGNSGHKNDHIRSMSVEMMARLFKVSGCVFVNLQKDATEEELEFFSQAHEFMDFRADLNDFADTAALITCLDLVIGVDTAVIHLAGALARPVWVLLPFVSDWRWLQHRFDSPWYPSADLFRQSEPQSWQGVMERVVVRLERAVAGEIF